MLTTICSRMTRQLPPLGPEDTLAHARSLFDEHRLRHWPVSAHGALVGIVGLRDLDKLDDPTAQVQTVMRPPVSVVLERDHVFAASLLMQRHRLSCLPVLDGEVLVGVVAQVDVVRWALALLDEEAARAGEPQRVADLMTRAPLATVHVLDPLPTATLQMKRYGVRHLPVLDEEGLLVGILSDRDLVRVRGNETVHLVGEVMTPCPATTSERVSAAAAGRALDSVGALPVLDGPELVGILSKGDFLTYLMGRELFDPREAPGE